VNVQIGLQKKLDFGELQKLAPDKTADVCAKPDRERPDIR
jgi:hypothetical protein